MSPISRSNLTDFSNQCFFQASSKSFWRVSSATTRRYYLPADAAMATFCVLNMPVFLSDKSVSAMVDFAPAWRAFQAGKLCHSDQQARCGSCRATGRRCGAVLILHIAQFGGNGSVLLQHFRQLCAFQVCLSGFAKPVAGQARCRLQVHRISQTQAIPFINCCISRWLAFAAQGRF